MHDQSTSMTGDRAESHYLLNFFYNYSDRTVSNLFIEIKGCIFSSQCAPHIFMVRGHLGVLISQMGKKGIEGKVIFLVTVRYTHHWFPDIFRSLPSIFFLPLLAPPTTPLYLSISIASSLTRSFPFSPRGAEVVEGHSDLARFQHGGSERGGENKTTKVQQCTVNTFAPIKLVKTSKNAFWKCCRPDWCPRCTGRSLSQDIPHCIHLLRIRALS